MTLQAYVPFRRSESTAACQYSEFEHKFGTLGFERTLDYGYWISVDRPCSGTAISLARKERVPHSALSTLNRITQYAPY